MMGLHKVPSGSWGYSIQKDGKRVRRVVGTKAEAEAAYLAEKGRLKVSDCTEKLYPWMEKVVKRSASTNTAVNTLLSYRTSIKAITNYWPNQTLDMITADDVEAFIEDQQVRLSASSINKIVMFLSKCYSMAIDKGLLHVNPCKGKRLVQGQGRVRFLSVDEIKRLMNNTTQPVRDIIELAVYTGLRKDEIFALTWEDVRKSTVLVQRKWKGGNIQAVRVSQEALAVIHRQPNDYRHVFPTAKGQRRKSCRTAFERGVRKAELKDVTFHTLRHTFASHAVMNGMSLRVLQELLGHTKIEMVLKYANLTSSHVDTVLANVSRDLSKEIS